MRRRPRQEDRERLVQFIVDLDPDPNVIAFGNLNGVRATTYLSVIDDFDAASSAPSGGEATCSAGPPLVICGQVCVSDADGIWVEPARINVLLIAP